MQWHKDSMSIRGRIMTPDETQHEAKITKYWDLTNYVKE